MMCICGSENVTELYQDVRVKLECRDCGNKAEAKVVELPTARLNAWEKLRTIKNVRPK